MPSHVSNAMHAAASTLENNIVPTQAAPCAISTEKTLVRGSM